MGNIGIALHSASRRKLFNTLTNERLVVDRIVFSLENDPMPYIGCNKGYDVWTRLQNTTLSDTTIKQIQSNIVNTVIQDLSVKECSCVIDHNEITDLTTVNVYVTLLSGNEFTLSLEQKIDTWTIS